jgi:hypothetical protein
VIELYRTTTGLNFYVNWGALERQGITKETPVSFQLDNISTAQALDYTMKTINGTRDVYSSAYWVVDKGVVMISTGEELNKTLRTRVYDISDMLAIIANREGPKVSIRGIGQGGLTDYSSQSAGGGVGGGSGGGMGGGLFSDVSSSNTTQTQEPSDAEKIKKKKEQITQMIQSSIGEEFWAPTGKGNVSIFNNHLIVKQTLLGFKLMAGGR